MPKHTVLVMRVRCRCSRHYDPGDIINLFGNISRSQLERHLRRCERCGVEFILPSGRERESLKLRRLVEIRAKKMPVWPNENVR